jgi:hypothetical protein
VLRRLVEEPDALARVADAALDICHFAPPSTEEPEAEEHTCTRACYRCLLSYSNQPYHAAINRHAIQSILADLSQSQVTQNDQRAITESGNESVADASASSPTAPDSTALGPAGQRVLDYIRAHGGREPDALLPDVLGHRPHLRYGARAFILCPEPGESVAEMRDDLEDNGYTIIVIRADRNLGEQLAPFSFWKSNTP